MNIIYHELPSGDLASRNLAIPQRQKIEEAISSQESVIEIDLRSVSSISESYADELFGVLVKTYGQETVLSHMKLVNADDFILHSIASVIKRRSQEFRACA
ncbi:STAS-like domain-containing protein [Aquirhabdus parva]|uniref:DUF4325 domain-containing protein n=1 Tax=Aquirhabdus parva TaxID=2283318 RepID=A0A345P9A6_9GAMM|nr:STAS-like domain-containing protein [Aquirhabdus parva]AXI03865.1 DUF4325 domain-containing protein [Aquirhabdus parva]